MPPNPVALEHQRQQLRQEFFAYRDDLAARIYRDPENQNQPFNMESNHAAQNNNIRAARRQRRDRNDQQAVVHPPAAQPDEGNPPIDQGGVIVAGEPVNNQVDNAPPVEQPEVEDMDI